MLRASIFIGGCLHASASSCSAAVSTLGAIVKAGKPGGILHDPCRLTSAPDRPLIFDKSTVTEAWPEVGSAGDFV